MIMMIWLGVVLIFYGVGAQQGSGEGSAPCVETDIQPPGEYTCQQQKNFGKCNASWMISGGFCDLTCGRTKCDQAPLDSCECSDIAPTGFSATCEQQKRWGKCKAIWMIQPKPIAPNGFCQKTCGRCSCPAALPCQCKDVQPRGSSYTCEQQKRFGKCTASWLIEGDFCAITCGRCVCPDQAATKDKLSQQEVLTSAVPSSPSPNPPSPPPPSPSPSPPSPSPPSPSPEISPPPPSPSPEIFLPPPNPTPPSPSPEVSPPPPSPTPNPAPVIPSPPPPSIFEEVEFIYDFCPPQCNEQPPPNGLTCFFHAFRGECDQDYMQGYCECSCQRCGALTQQN